MEEFSCLILKQLTSKDGVKEEQKKIGEVVEFWD